MVHESIDVYRMSGRELVKFVVDSARSRRVMMDGFRNDAEAARRAELQHLRQLIARTRERLSSGGSLALVLAAEWRRFGSRRSKPVIGALRWPRSICRFDLRFDILDDDRKWSDVTRMPRRLRVDLPWPPKSKAAASVRRLRRAGRRGRAAE